MTDPALPLSVRAAHTATAKRSTSFVGLGRTQLVDQIEDVVQRPSDVLDVVPVVGLGEIHMGHLAQVFIQALDATGQVINSPTTQEGGNTQNDVEKNLHVIHVTSPTKAAL